MNQYTGGTVATMIVVPLLLVVCLAVAGTALRARRTSPGEVGRRRAGGKAAAAVGAAVLIVAATVWGMYPWRADYHEYRPMSGTVMSVDPRVVVNGSGGIDDKYVVRFDGDDREYVVYDARVAAARVGDVLSVVCVRRWQWTGSHGFDCEFVDLAEKVVW